MNFMEAIKAMKKGKKVRCKNFSFEHYFELDEENNLIGMNGVQQILNVEFLEEEFEILGDKGIPEEDKVFIPLSEKEISWQEPSNKWTTHQGFITQDVKEAVIELKKYLKNWSESDCHNIKLKEIFGDLVEE